MKRGRLSFRKLVRVFMRPLPRPVHVLNFIVMADEASYRRYALAVVPLLVLAGGRVRWVSRVVRQVFGPDMANDFLIVSYPSHRRWLLMVANPYYLLINRFRVRAVAAFEASFSTPEIDEPLNGHEQLYAVHFNELPQTGGVEALQRVLSRVGGRCVYAARETAPIALFDRYRDSDPKPLRFKKTALFAFAEAAALDAACTPAVVTSLCAVTSDLGVQVLQRERPNWLPGRLRRLIEPRVTGEAVAERPAMGCSQDPAAYEYDHEVPASTNGPAAR